MYFETTSWFALSTGSSRNMWSFACMYAYCLTSYRASQHFVFSKVCRNSCNYMIIWTTRESNAITASYLTPRKIPHKVWKQGGEGAWQQEAGAWFYSTWRSSNCLIEDKKLQILRYHPRNCGKQCTYNGNLDTFDHIHFLLQLCCIVQNCYEQPVSKKAKSTTTTDVTKVIFHHWLTNWNTTNRTILNFYVIKIATRKDVNTFKQL